jgi:Raf kinase inhibitor-like YbhB/YbcL family protein
MSRATLAVALLAAGAAFADKPTPPPPPAPTTTPAHPAAPAPPMPALLDPNPAPVTIKVSLPGLENGVVDDANVFKGMGCTGDNKSLAVSWTGAPRDTKSFAVIVHDPDAPTGVGFFHWTVFNLPASTTRLDLGASGAGIKKAGGVEGYTDFGRSGYGGPCPPPGPAHRYIVTVYALKVPRLEGADATSTGALLRFMLGQSTLALGRVTATYGK